MTEQKAQRWRKGRVVGVRVGDPYLEHGKYKMVRLILKDLKAYRKVPHGSTEHAAAKAESDGEWYTEAYGRDGIELRFQRYYPNEDRVGRDESTARWMSPTMEYVRLGDVDEQFLMRIYKAVKKAKHADCCLTGLVEALGPNLRGVSYREHGCYVQWLHSTQEEEALEALRMSLPAAPETDWRPSESLPEDYAA
jgi:hypothetical protein